MWFLPAGVSSLLELSRQTDIKYGTLNGTAVETFFLENRADPYPKMYQFMNTYDTWMPNGSAAIDRVQGSFDNPDGQKLINTLLYYELSILIMTSVLLSPMWFYLISDKYGFIFDSTILEYAARNEPCTTRTLGDIFRRVGYGIALKKKSPFTPKFDSAILKLRENGEIEALVDKWMQGPCQVQIGNILKKRLP